MGTFPKDGPHNIRSTQEQGLQDEHKAVTSLCLIAPCGFFSPFQAGSSAFCFEEPGKCIHRDLPALCLD